MGIKGYPAGISANILNDNSLCLSLLRIILSIDKYRIIYIDPCQFKDDAFGLNLREMNCLRPMDTPEGVAFVAQHDKKKLLFCFGDQGPARLSEIANMIRDSDKGQFDSIGIMIVRDEAGMKDRRRVSKADEWPRGFFSCFEEIRRKAEGLTAKGHSGRHTCAPLTESHMRTSIMSVMAEVKENIPVGENGGHYKLRFQTARSFNVTPGQFIMTDTTPRGQDTIAGPVALESMNFSRIAPRSYLKRPFGIHRSFYRHFDKDYLQKLSLPPALATVLHTVFPDEFEIFYKVLTNGVGTKELSGLKKGARIQIVGPLGKDRIIREIRDEAVEEIHVIGGGVGMAPLIFMVQALRYYSYNVKAFIGTEKISMLKYKREAFDGLDATFTDEDPAIYIDDLLETGLKGEDIYVSSAGPGSSCAKIPENNLYEGFVSDQYNKYLRDASAGRKKILALACGPTGMMKALASITGGYGIPLKVLMEKRMACGIGVCLSCVCETKNPGEAESKYSRVCADGPIFNASEIIWQ